MSDDPMRSSEPAADDLTGRVLQAAGPRAPVSAHREAAVRAAVHGAWRSQTRRRIARRRLVIASSVAAAVLALVVSRFGSVERVVVAPGLPVAVVDGVDGPVPLERSAVVRVGDWIETGTEARVALRFGDGGPGTVSVRLDAGSRLRALSRSSIELAAGTVYVDSGEHRGGFEVRTPLGIARDIGTQFEVRVTDAAVRLRVRTGVVQLADGTRLISGNAGTEVILSAADAATRQIATYGPEWAWTVRVAPVLEMEGASLAGFLDQVGREHGWSIQYRDPALARAAETITLHGSARGLSAEQAIAVAMAASGLRHRLEHGALMVDRGDPPE